MRRVDLLCSLMPIVVVAILPGCKGHSIVDFENPEIASWVSLAKEVSPEIRERYSVDGVLVIPSIGHSRLETRDSGYEAWIAAFSPEMVEVEIKELSLTIDGKPIVLESPFSDRVMDDFKYSEDYQAFRAYVISPPFNVQAPEDRKKLHVILTVEVRRRENTTKSGSLEAIFKPRKRTYYFPQA